MIFLHLIHKVFTTSTFLKFCKNDLRTTKMHFSSIAVSGGSDATVKCWDLRSKRMQPVQTMEETGDTVTSIDVSSHEIVVGSADAKVSQPKNL